MLAFSGLGEGRYRLDQTVVPAGYKKMNSMVFDISMTGKDGRITALSAKDKSGRKLPWDVSSETGIIHAIIVNN